jgi:2-oxoisovalerate dehydrogenase E2 component (dihydrolipoyl transacylase)
VLAAQITNHQTYNTPPKKEPKKMPEMLLPELAESVVEGEILKWLVSEGDLITLEQPIVEVMTDKVTVELPSPFAGRLERILALEGSIVGVHKPIAFITETIVEMGEGSSKVEPVESTEPKLEEPKAEPKTEPKATAGDELSLFKAFGEEDTLELSGLNVGGGSRGKATAHAQKVRVAAIPAARQLAGVLGLELADILGSGPEGRVEVSDVHQHARALERNRERQLEEQNRKPALPVAPVQYKTPKGFEALETRTPLRGMRRAIANQMLASHLYTVRTLTVDEANLTKLVALRSSLKTQAENQGVKLSYLPFIFKAVVTALKKYPSLNSSFDEASGEIVSKHYYNLGMAVATDAGLMVPVIREVDQKSPLVLAREINEVASSASAGKLTPEQMTGSTFSITNIGSIGAQFSFPIINVPDAAILGVHSITKKPIVAQDADGNDQIVIAHMMYLAVSFDHRLVDGAEAARFCREVIRLLENPELLLLEGI